MHSQNESRHREFKDTPQETNNEKQSQNSVRKGQIDSEKSAVISPPSLKRKRPAESEGVPHKKEKQENKVFISSLFRFNPEIPTVEK